MAETKRKHPKVGTMTKLGFVVGRGTNKTVIPPEEVEKLAAMHASIEEMAAFFGIPANTLSSNFGDIITKARASTKVSLRREQIKVALNGNVTMLIWLGKQYLGQADKIVEEKPDSIPADELDNRIKSLIETMPELKV
jgi:hypothetical protein